jgi:hypothetical protein
MKDININNILNTGITQLKREGFCSLQLPIQGDESYVIINITEKENNYKGDFRIVSQFGKKGYIKNFNNLNDLINWGKRFWEEWKGELTKQ